MKIFVIDKSPNGGNGNIATLHMKTIPQVGDQVCIKDLEGNTHEYIVRSRRFVLRKSEEHVKLKSGEWQKTVVDKIRAVALNVVTEEAFAKELQSFTRE